jgi:hypothetical protein
MAEEKRKTVKVSCTQTNGLSICLFHKGYDDGTGIRQVVRDGPHIRLNGPSGLIAGTTTGDHSHGGAPGITEVDAEWWSKWLEQNTGKNPLLDAGVVAEVREEENPTP